MDKIDIDDEAMTITIGAGVRWKAVYDKLKGNRVEYIVVGGQCPTVGVCGFTILEGAWVLFLGSTALVVTIF